jgi:hypothetical protein
MNKVVARFRDGRMVKGETSDFLPTKDQFHVSVVPGTPGAKPVAIQTRELKALFFVRDYAGDSAHVDRDDLALVRPGAGRPIKVVFRDGEVLVGTTTGYQPGRPGFFLVPVDPGSNIERCYVVSESAEQISFL